jgi:hypothetical protein
MYCVKPEEFASLRVVRSKLFATLAIIGGVLALQFSPPKCEAAIQGITVSPFLQQVDINAADTTKTFSLTLTNNTQSAQQLTLSTQDVGSLSDSGGIRFISRSDYQQRYGLTSWIALATDLVDLNPGQSKAVEVTIENKTSLQPGGHYGVVIAYVASATPQASDGVQISQQLTSLIFVTKHGGEHYDLSLKAVAPNGNWLHLPDTVRLQFYNPGNVHVIPRGIVSLKNAAGHVIAHGVINDDSNIILPDASRQIYVKLSLPNTALQLPGPYSISVDYRYDGLATTTNKTVLLHFIGLKIYLVIIVMLGLLGFVVVSQYRRSKAGRQTISKKPPSNL